MSAIPELGSFLASEQAAASPPPLAAANGNGREPVAFLAICGCRQDAPEACDAGL